MRKLAYILGLVVLASSCQKVIDVDLNEANENVVIEANYMAENDRVEVIVTKTSNFFNQDPSPKVSDAVVTITDQNGASTVVPHVSGGLYRLTQYAPTYDSRYTITVVVDGQTYTASSNLATPVQIDPITYFFIDGFFGADPGYVTYLNYQDPANTTDFYQVIITENGVTYDDLDDFIPQDDALTNGNYVQRPLFFGELNQIGDTIAYEFRTVDEAPYEYAIQAADIAGGSNSAAPGNPITNWDNGALGYFSAYGVSRDTVIIQ